MAEKNAILIAKYYPPPQGWGTWLDDIAQLDEFFVAHRHDDLMTEWSDGMWGYHIYPRRDHDPGEAEVQ